MQYGRGKTQRTLLTWLHSSLLTGVSFTFTFSYFFLSLFQVFNFYFLLYSFILDILKLAWMQYGRGKTQRALLTWLHSSLLTSFPFSLSYGKHRPPDAVKRIKYLTSYTNICRCKKSSPRAWKGDKTNKNIIVLTYYHLIFTCYYLLIFFGEKYPHCKWKC